MLTMRHDFRAPALRARVERGDLLGRARACGKWADAQGWDMAVLSEHHGIDDGWMPAPLTIAGIDPRLDAAHPGLRVGVDPAAARSGAHRRADRGARQRGAGPADHGVRRGLQGRRVRDGRRADTRTRGKVLEEYVDVVVRALTGEPFEWQGRTITVTPRPVTQAAPDDPRRRWRARRGAARGAACGSR